MTDSGNTGQGKVATRAIAAAAWSVALLAFIWPLRLVNLTVLNRSGVHVFGFWTYLNMLLALIPSLCLFGGSRVLVYFLPKCPEGTKRRFVMSFAALAMSGALVGLGVIFLFPSLHAYLGIEEHSRLVMLFLLVAVPIEVINQVIRGLLQGSLRLADSEKALGIPQAIELLLLVIVFLVFPDFALRHHVMLLMGTIVLRLLVTLAASAAMGVGTLREDVDGTTRPLPRGMWRYAGYLHLNQLVDFVYMHADRWIVLYFF
ncbi:MAG TPA: hypothetical protein VMX57_01660, partial [Planctomycetota bacterium]|nr:hypothetical protein [Planctomycetota bacterium]